MKKCDNTAGHGRQSNIELLYDSEHDDGVAGGCHIDGASLGLPESVTYIGMCGVRGGRH